MTKRPRLGPLVGRVGFVPDDLIEDVALDNYERALGPQLAKAFPRTEKAQDDAVLTINSVVSRLVQHGFTISRT